MRVDTIMSLTLFMPFMGKSIKYFLPFADNSNINGNLY